ncbi:glycoside hydrolase superfamily [Lipomyces kononenkoae]|uniref:Glycoside hydrolase superfamily n=1 Tax=Lipomyces kononenkoae TaxID=34357 RepID=A0ACC3SR88_LIPKO
MVSEILHVAEGTKIVDGSGNEVVLRGTSLGGWMMMENFMNGFPGREMQIRKAIRNVLGQEKSDFFFDKFLEYFFTDEDAVFLKSLGLNSLRVPFNYRHLEDDMNPGVVIPEGFKHIDRVVDICARHGIYTILDLHSAPGGQSQDWHCDNPTGYAAFWDQKSFQDRVVHLWTIIAARYKGNPWVAGYNPLNEPADEQWTRLLAFYERIERAIREVDPDHILWLDGNTFSMDFSGFTKIFPNTVYAIHDYCGYGFPNRIGRYQGEAEQDKYIRAMYDRKVEFMKKHNVPIWNGKLPFPEDGTCRTYITTGEFGPIYEREEYNPDYKVHNQERYNMLEKQLSIYSSEGIHWSIWSYKDVNVMGMRYVSPNSEWIKLLGPFIRKKRELAVDSWAYDDVHLQEGLFGPLHKWFEENIPEKYGKKYPWQWRMHMHVFRGVRGITMAEYLVPEFADYFRGKSYEDLDALAKSWSFENTVGRDKLNNLLKLHSTMKPDDPQLVNVIRSAAENKHNSNGVFELSPLELDQRK